MFVNFIACSLFYVGCKIEKLHAVSGAKKSSMLDLMGNTIMLKRSTQA